MFTAFEEVPAAAAAAVPAAAAAVGGVVFKERSISSKNRVTFFPVRGGWDAPWLFVAERTYTKTGE